VEINARTIDEAATAVSDPWSAIVAAFDAFLGTIADPSASGFASSAPASLGLEDCWAWREGTEIDLIRRAGSWPWTGPPTPRGEREQFRTVMLQVMHGMVQMDAFKAPWSDGAAWTISSSVHITDTARK
jgi:hypothetical protein